MEVGRRRRCLKMQCEKMRTWTRTLSPNSSGEIQDTRYTYWQLLNRSSRRLKWNAALIFMHLQLTRDWREPKPETGDRRPRPRWVSVSRADDCRIPLKRCCRPRKNIQTLVLSRMCNPKSRLGYIFLFLVDAGEPVWFGIWLLFPSLFSFIFFLVFYSCMLKIYEFGEYPARRIQWTRLLTWLLRCRLPGLSGQIPDMVLGHVNGAPQQPRLLLCLVLLEIAFELD